MEHGHQHGRVDEYRDNTLMQAIRFENKCSINIDRPINVRRQRFHLPHRALTRRASCRIANIHNKMTTKRSSVFNELFHYGHRTRQQLLE